MFRRAKVVIAIYILGVALVLLGLSFYMYASAAISDLQAKLSVVAIGQGNYYALEGSLQWWRNETFTVYGPLAFYLILVGLGVLSGSTAYVARAALRNKSKIKKITLEA
jgi:hypothetical protein